MGKNRYNELLIKMVMLAHKSQEFREKLNINRRKRKTNRTKKKENDETSEQSEKKTRVGRGRTVTGATWLR